MAKLAEIAEHISMCERRAMAAERDSTDRYVAAFMEDRVGAVFDARITGVTRFGLFVRLKETGADGLSPSAPSAREYFKHDERRHALVGERSGTAYALGDTVTVRLAKPHRSRADCGSSWLTMVLKLNAPAAEVELRLHLRKALANSLVDAAESNYRVDAGVVFSGQHSADTHHGGWANEHRRTVGPRKSHRLAIARHETPALDFRGHAYEIGTGFGRQQAGIHHARFEISRPVIVSGEQRGIAIFAIEPVQIGGAGEDVVTWRIGSDPSP